MAGALEYRDKDIFKTLLHLCELRGEDSTGFFTVGKDSEIPVSFKNVGPTRHMFETVPWDRLTLANKRVAIGHCRKATVGGVSRATAHPFTFDHITGVHNGTLRNWRSLPGVNEVTDTAMLFKNFAETGVRPTIEATDGAYALIWWDEREGLLNILKNNERSLFYAFSEDCKKIIWASEDWMIEVACARHGMKLADMSKKEDPFAEYTRAVDDDLWWRIRPGKAVAEKALSFLKDEPLVGGVKKASTAPFRGPYSWSSPWGTDDLDDDPNDVAPAQTPLLTPPVTTNSADASQTTSSSSPTSTTPAASPKRRTTLSLVPSNKSDGSDGLDEQGLKPYLEGNNGLVLDEDEFEALVCPNCLWCQEPYTFEELKDQGKLGEWNDDDSFICKDCLHDVKLAGVY